MRTDGLLKKVAVAAICLFSIQLPGPAFAASVTLPAGTSIQLEFADTIDSETAADGQKVNMKVIYDVKVKNVTVIKGGTIADAKVISVERKGILGKPGTIGVQVRSVRAVDGTIQVRSVRAVDGTMVPLSASKVVKGESKETKSVVITLLLCVFAIFIKGEPATMQAGSVMEAQTLGDVTIQTD
jgi:hypothetical protein